MPLYNAALAPAVPKNSDKATVSALTEDSGAVGGTNDGNMPDIGTVSGTYTQAEVVAIRDAVREVAAKLNELMVHMNNGRTSL